MAKTFVILLPALAALASIASGVSTQDPGSDSDSSEEPWKLDVGQHFDIVLDEVPANDVRSLGSCAKWKDRIEQAFTEANLMLEAALDTADMIDDKAPRLNRPLTAEGKNWYRINQVHWTLFVCAKGKDHIQKSAEFTTTIYKHLLAPFVENRGDQQPIVRCGDDFLRPLGPNTPDPRDRGTKYEGKYTIAQPRQGQKAYPHGAYYALNVGSEHIFLPYENYQGITDPRHPICSKVNYGKEGSIIYAETQMMHELIILCPDLLDNPYWSVDELEKRVQPWVTPLAAFDRTIAKVLVHELVHTVFKFDDPEQLQDDGNPLRPAEGDGIIAMHGWHQAWLLARSHLGEAYKGPENIAYYALAAYLDGWNWAAGKASYQPVPINDMDWILKTPIARAQIERERIAATNPQGSAQLGMQPQAAAAGSSRQQEQSQMGPQRQSLQAGSSKQQGQPMPNTRPQDPHRGSSKKSGNSGKKPKSSKGSTFGGLFGSKKSGQSSSKPHGRSVLDLEDFLGNSSARAIGA